MSAGNSFRFSFLTEVALLAVVACGGGTGQHEGSGASTSAGGRGGSSGGSGGVSAGQGGHNGLSISVNVSSTTESDAGVCGDGVLNPGEQCDDGNTVPGDGCSGMCTIEPGWACPTPGQPCVKVWICGNGIVDPGEECDLGSQNGAAGSGCTSTCTVESGFTCASAGPDAGSVCKTIDLCGNGVVDPGEQCDTGPMNGTGGCTTSCTIVPGWTCPPAGRFACTTICGDGIIAGNEQCDFGPSDAGNTPGEVDAGVYICSPTTCTIAPGWACTQPATSPADCHQTVCGDGIKEGTEECDDGNRRPYDGCSPWCTIEPTCSGGTCTAVCGDGIVTPPEQCDDGNTIAGDGCSATCTIEPGWTCTTVTESPGTSLTIPILFRDMHWCNESYCGNNSGSGQSTTNNALLTPPTAANGHPDFNNKSLYVTNPAPPERGLVNSTLGADNEPVFASATAMDASAPSLTNATDYCWWYHDTGCDGADAGTTDAGTGDPNPFAMDVWLDATGNPTTLVLNQQGSTYTYSNYAFFPLDGLGWNNPSPTANPGWYDDPQTATDCSTNSDGGPIPSAAHNFSFTSELHYRFTYDANAAPPVFAFGGDDDVWAFLNGKLFIDLGGIHGHLPGSVTLDPATAASFGLQDQGTYSIDLFQAERNTCASTYVLTVQDFVHKISQCTQLCGDGLPGTLYEVLDGGAIVDAGMAKQCDLGTLNEVSNNTGAYGGCTSTCQLAPYCGDGIVQTADGEQCDLGTANNVGGYGGCNPNCTLGPYCGDGVVEPPEQCDYGTANNTGGCGGCTANCTFGPYCGDGIVDTQCGEVCDGTPGCVACKEVEGIH